MNSENSTFHFQKFTVEQEHTAMKVGTDGVLLGAWANGKNAASMLDVGAGTGILSLMIAQRFPQTSITAIEPDQGAFTDLSTNTRNSSFSSRINPIRSRLQDFSGVHFDYLVTNPPYFASGIIASGTRGTARHATDLPHKILIQNALRLLNNRGKLGVILPFESPFIPLALTSGMFLNRQCIVYADLHEPPIRRMMEFSRQLTAVRHETLYIRRNGRYSDEYLALTGEFYLDLT